MKSKVRVVDVLATALLACTAELFTGASPCSQQNTTLTSSILQCQCKIGPQVLLLLGSRLSPNHIIHPNNTSYAM